MQTPIAAALYYNLQTFNTTPEQALAKFREVGEQALACAIEHVRQQTAIYKQRTALPVREAVFNPRVLTFDEFAKIVADGDADKVERVIASVIEDCAQNTSVDERELNIRIIAALHELCPLREPLIIMFFAPPYYPHVSLQDNTPFEKHLRNCAKRLMERAWTDYGETILERKYFQGLSDLSYFAAQDGEAVTSDLAPNMPTWGKTYELPLNDIRELNLPVINYGPHGRDPHKYTERLHKEYSLTKAPQLLRTLIDDIFSFYGS